MAKDYGDYFNIAHIEPESYIYGPGKRFVIWVQGCSLACKGCWNEDMWSFSSKRIIHRQELLDMILRQSGLHGVTFLGGEPLHQLQNLIILLNQIRDQSSLTVFLYTGYDKGELEQMGVWNHLSRLCDIMVIGRYDEQQRDIFNQWQGSGNQQIVYPSTTRETQQAQILNEAEILITENGSTRIIGYPDERLLDGFE